MSELFSMSLFWFFILAGLFTFFMQRASRSWGGLNETFPMIMTMLWPICYIAMIVLLVFVFIRVKPWWYGLIFIAAEFLLSTFLPLGRKGEAVAGVLGIIGAPLFIVLSFVQVFTSF